MSIVVYGQNEMVLSSTDRTWSPEKGEGFVYTYGPAPIGAADDFFNLKKQDPLTDYITMKKSDGVATVEITTYDDDGEGGPVSSEENDLWEVTSMDNSKDLMQFSGRLAKDLDGGSYSGDRLIDFTDTGNDSGGNPIQTELALIRKYVETAGDVPGTSTYIPELQYKALLERGVSEFVRSIVVLRRTITAGRRSNIKASWAGVDRAWLLDGELGSPNLKRDGQAALIGALEDMPDIDVTKKQWLKKAPQIQQVGKRRYNISYEWWFSPKWSWILYAGDGLCVIDENKI